MRPLSRKGIARIPVLPYLQANQAAAVKFRLLGAETPSEEAFRPRLVPRLPGDVVANLR
jgi:hypothetical protein